MSIQELINRLESVRNEEFILDSTEVLIGVLVNNSIKYIEVTDISIVESTHDIPSIFIHEKRLI